MGKFVYNNLLPEEQQLPIYFHTACEWHAQEDISRPCGAKSFWQILLVLEGRGTVTCNGQTYQLQKGCAFFTAPDVPVEYKNAGGLVTAFLSAKGSALKELMAFYVCDGFLFYESVNLDKYIGDINRIQKDYYTHRREGVLSAMTYAVFVDFFELQRDRRTRLDDVKLYIEKQFMEKLTLERLAQVGAMSVSKLCHDFKTVHGCSVFRYILDLRLSYARAMLLSQPGTATKEAAVACGFEDVSYFCRAYKKKFGCSPAEDKRKEQ